MDAVLLLCLHCGGADGPNFQREEPILSHKACACSIYFNSRFLPLRAGGRASLPALAPAAQAMPSPDVQALALDAARRELSGQVERALSAAGVAYRFVDVQLTCGGEEVEVERVTVGVSPGQKTDGAHEAVARAMGAEVPIVLQEEGS